MASDRAPAVRRCVEYYLSDANLSRDEYFRDLVLDPGTGGWVDASRVLSCPKMDSMGVGRAELSAALADSAHLEVDSQGGLGSLRIRRRTPYDPGAATAADPPPGGKAAGKGKGKGKGGKGQEKGGKGYAEAAGVRPGPEYDPSQPCGWHLAGHCRYGQSCGMQHSVPYAMAVRAQWLAPEDKALRDRLQRAAEDALGESARELFPRVFARPVRTAGHGAAGGVVSGPRLLAVLDLEGKDEIAEFPVLILDAVARQEVGRFQCYVRPSKLFEGLPINPESPADTFPVVLRKFDSWLQQTLGRGLDSFGADLAFLTCGDFDCRHVHRQCGISEIPCPPAFDRWINIKRTWADHYGCRVSGMRTMLGQLKMLDAQGFVRYGFHHLGMHDVENIARCALHLLENGIPVTLNGAWTAGGRRGP
eukprot:TRINITY_DN2776_c4_g1_i1.p1 TRINITY_DN2776_c4_g1~~TRINITY_DN2776_c4_g1_i1.p1  ORF type:complete len:458 (+),score=143.01 TRINITY_DN2776_c4_g1_i1:119-1375(+)